MSERERAREREEKGFVEGKEEGREGQSGYLINKIIFGGAEKTGCGIPRMFRLGKEDEDGGYLRDTWG